MRVCVYVRLIDQGRVSYRATTAELLAPLLGRLETPTDFEPDSEAWEFEAGSVVRLERRLLDGDEVYVAVRRAADPSRSS